MTPVKAPDQVRAKADAICVAAVDAAREAAVEEAGAAQVGAHLSYRVEGERLLTHYFASTHPGYLGWCWAVTLTRASRAKTVTVNEVVMLPGDEAIVAPQWVPWSDRVQPGDLRPGDLYPTPPDDPRLVPGFADTGAPDEVLEVVEELGLGRARVLSPIGRDDAAERWYGGELGPESPIAQAAPYKCSSCGYWIRLADSLGRVFGACSNEMAPGEGRVVAADYGCGAHSDVVVESVESPSSEHAFDTTGYDDLDPVSESASASESAGEDFAGEEVEPVEVLDAAGPAEVAASVEDVPEAVPSVESPAAEAEAVEALESSES